MAVVEVVKEISILTDINTALDNDKIDDLMLRFMHIYEQLDSEIINKLKLDKFKDEILKWLDDLGFRRQLDLHYKILENPDEATLLLDKRVTDEELYNLNKDLYQIVKGLRTKIFIALGKIKKTLKSTTEVDMGKF